MRKWIDLALITNESELAEAISNLGSEEKSAISIDLLQVLNVDTKDLEDSILRILIERSRSFALPREIWTRSITSSSPLEKENREHLKKLGIPQTPERLRSMNELYAEFVVDQRDAKVTKNRLEIQNFRCYHCGLAFCNEQLSDLGLISPHGDRKKAKTDPLKEHWTKDKYRLPRADHHWPISTFGSNRSSNIYVICDGCNEGKASFLALQHFPAWVGMYERTQLAKGKVPLHVFYAQVRRQAVCAVSGKTAKDSELTVVVRDAALPPVLDNLKTVESKGI